MCPPPRHQVASLRLAGIVGPMYARPSLSTPSAVSRLAGDAGSRRGFASLLFGVGLLVVSSCGSSDGASDTIVPVTAVADTAVPDTAVPDTDVPDTVGTEVPDTEVPDTEVPDTVGNEAVSSFELEVGDCLSEEAVGEVESVPVVPCSELHDTELFHAFDLVGDEYPGLDAIQDEVLAQCVPAFKEFIGVAYEDSAWDISTIFPTQDTWDSFDDREVLCGVFPVTDEDTTGSARGIAE